jgi:hypothetical protein
MDFNIIGKIFKFTDEGDGSVEVEPYNEDIVKVLYGFKEEHYRWDCEHLITKATMSQIHLTVFVKLKKFSPQILYI